jgi:hypothetical protein
LKKQILIIAGFALCTALGTKAQVINIENMRMHTDSVRLAGSFHLSLAFNSTNGKNIGTIRGNAAVQWKSRDYKHLLLTVADYNFAKAAEENFVNAFYLHLRYNLKISSVLRWEAFTQSQTNEPLGVSYRHLLGTGPRFKITLARQADLYLGTAYMYEYEKTVGPNRVISHDSRSSSYFSFNIRIAKINGTIISTSYYQPLFTDFSDHRIMNDTRFSFSITQKWQVFTNFSYFYDSRPPAGIRRSALNLEQGFGIKF